ncbi:MAG: sulfotransferase [Pseudomonadota bacterium]
MSEPTLVICVGAQKAGTSWLMQYLRDHPDCPIRRVKELHYFDTLDDPAGSRFAAERVKQLTRLRKKAGFFTKDGRIARQTMADIRAANALRPGSDGSHDAYVAYLMKGAGSKRVVAEATPVYGTLGRAVFDQMLRLTDDVRLVLLLRDPLDRAWSQARHDARMWTLYTKTSGPAPAARLRRYVNGEDSPIRRRSDYRSMLTELTAVVPRERLHIAFYEDLFDPRAQAQTLSRLTDYLGIRSLPGHDRPRVNAGKPQTLGARLRARCLVTLRSQDAYCHDFFSGALPERWRQHMAEDAGWMAQTATR